MLTDEWDNGVKLKVSALCHLPSHNVSQNARICQM
jgi:hypothetical protein